MDLGLWLMSWYISFYLVIRAVIGLRRGALVFPPKNSSFIELATLRGFWAYAWSLAFVCFVLHTWRALLDEHSNVTVVWAQSFGISFFYQGWLGCKKRVLVSGGRGGDSVHQGFSAVILGLVIMALSSIGLAAPYYSQIRAFIEEEAARI